MARRLAGRATPEILEWFLDPLMDVMCRLRGDPGLELAPARDCDLWKGDCGRQLGGRGTHPGAGESESLPS